MAPSAPHLRDRYAIQAILETCLPGEGTSPFLWRPPGGRRSPSSLPGGGTRAPARTPALPGRERNSPASGARRAPP